MLLLCSESDQVIDIKMLRSTKAIMFFGTPHRGSGFADLGETIRRIASAAGFDTARQNLRALEIDSGVLEECHRRFQHLQSQQQFDILTFQESRGVAGIAYGGINRKVVLGSHKNSKKSANVPWIQVVEDISSQFTGTEPIRSIDANHMDMCRFPSRDDTGYRRVADAFNSVIGNLLEEEDEG